MRCRLGAGGWVAASGTLHQPVMRDDLGARGRCQLIKSSIILETIITAYARDHLPGVDVWPLRMPRSCAGADRSSQVADMRPALQQTVTHPIARCGNNIHGEMPGRRRWGASACCWVPVRGGAKGGCARMYATRTLSRRAGWRSHPALYGSRSFEARASHPWGPVSRPVEDALLCEALA